MKVSKTFSEPALLAVNNAKTMSFIQDLLKIYKKHNLALTPQYNHEISFHEKMRVVPMDKEIEREIQHSLVCLEREETYDSLQWFCSQEKK